MDDPVNSIEESLWILGEWVFFRIQQKPSPEGPREGSILFEPQGYRDLAFGIWGRSPSSHFKSSWWGPWECCRSPPLWNWYRSVGEV